MTGELIKRLARECGFELGGVAAAEPSADFGRYREWVEEGFAGEMNYLTDRRAAVRSDPRNLLPSALSIICVGKLYNTDGPADGPISRYAWGDDYHRVTDSNGSSSFWNWRRARSNTKSASIPRRSWKGATPAPPASAGSARTLA
jgi:epoxyqueuosine reductase QueG